MYVCILICKGVEEFEHVGLFDILMGALDAIVMSVWSAVFMTPLRIIAVRKHTRVTDFEIKGTLAAAVAGVALSLAVSALFVRRVNLFLMGVMFLLVLIWEITIYWIGLWERRQSRPAHME